MNTKSKWEKRFRRERAAREAAEHILEEKAAQILGQNRELETIQKSLEEAVRQRTAELQKAVDDLNGEIDHRKEIERQLICARDEAIELGQQKEAFLARVSHDIRTPLNSVAGYARLLAETEACAEQRPRIEAMLDGCDILLRMVNDLLVLSRIDAGNVDLQLENCRLAEVVSDTLTIMKPEADIKGLDLSMEIAAGLPQTVQLDMSRLQQVLINLLSNAIKFTESGRVSVSLRVEEAADVAMPAGLQSEHDNAQVGLVEIRVSDTGAGVAKDVLPHLFDPYFQESPSSTDTLGAGLGLAICRKFCELMGGEITVVSELGKGSAFTFWVPCLSGQVQAASASDRKHIAPAAKKADLASLKNMALQHPLRILAADDNHENRAVLEDLLGFLGYRTNVVSNGEEALRAARQERYDVILMDVRMPQLDGVEATTAIQSELEGEDLPFIAAVTASAVEGEPERLLRAGMNAFIAKPIDIDLLADVLRRAYQSKERPSLPVPDGKEPVPAESSLHLDSLYHRLGEGADKLLARVIPIFLRELPGRIDRLETAIEQRDAAQVAAICHGLKGSSLSVGANSLAKASESMQLAADSGKLPAQRDLSLLHQCSRGAAKALHAKLQSIH